MGPAWVGVLRGLLAAVAVAAVLIQSVALLPPNKTDPIYEAQRYIRGWVFLTKHCLTLQAVHQVCTFVTSISDTTLAQVAYLSNCISFWIGGLGCFVTVQYVVLVHNNAEFKAACQERISRDPPDNLRRKCLILHIFALPLAVLDI